MLDELSAKNDVNIDPGSVLCSEYNALGVCYGSYKFATNRGVPDAFVDWLIQQQNPYGYVLRNAGNPGSREFSAAWQSIAYDDPQGFFELQYLFVKMSQ